MIGSVDAFEAFGHDLVVAMVELQMHGRGATAIKDAAARLQVGLDAISRRKPDQPSPRVVLDFAEGRVRADGQLLLGASLQARPLLRATSNANVRRILIELDGENAARGTDLVEFLETARQPDAPDTPTAWQRAMLKRGIRGIEVVLESSQRLNQAKRAPDETQTNPDDLELDALPGGASAAESAFRGYQRISEVLQANHVAAWLGADLDISAAEGIVERTLKMMQRQPSTLLALSHYDDVDRFTVGHSVRVALLAMHVASAAGADPKTLLRVGTAALLHDIGKGRIPQEILFKPGRLDDDEWHEMAQHPRLGAEVLMEQKDLDLTAVTASFCHHMTPDGGGYPRAAVRFEPSSVSRLVRVCDTFEALTAVRPYKPALTPIDAYVIMHRNGGAGLDRRWLSFFVQTIGLYPLGTRVLLDDGREAVVEATGPSAEKPVVRVVHGPQGTSLPADTPRQVRVGVEEDGSTPTVRPQERKHTDDIARQAADAARTPGGGCLPGDASCDHEHGPGCDGHRHG